MGAIEDILARMRGDYLRACLARAASMSRLLARLEAWPSDSDAVAGLCHHFHGLAGAGASYGFGLLSEVGSRGERSAQTCLERGQAVSREDHDTFASLVEQVRRIAATQLPSPQP
jgi:hypothetical protein